MCALSEELLGRKLSPPAAMATQEGGAAGCSAWTLHVHFKKRSDFGISDKGISTCIS